MRQTPNWGRQPTKTNRCNKKTLQECETALKLVLIKVMFIVQGKGQGQDPGRGGQGGQSDRRGGSPLVGGEGAVAVVGVMA